MKLARSVLSKQPAITARRMVSSMPPRYPGHIPLTGVEKVVLTIGSAAAALLNPRRADMIAALSETTSTPFLPGLRDTLFSTEEGRLILHERPRIHSEVINLHYLRELKEGTVGRVYCDWLERCGTSPDTRLPVHHVDDPELAYVLQRYRETHDFGHVLFDLPSTLVPELALKIFEASQTSLPMPFLSSLTVLSPFNTLTSTTRSALLRDYLPWALKAAAECKPLIGVYWEKRWEQDMDDLRRELGVILPGPGWEGLRYRKGTWKEREAAKKAKELEEAQLAEKEMVRLKKVESETKAKTERAEEQGRVAVAPGN